MEKRDLKVDLGIARGMKPLNTSEYYEGISLETAQQYMMAAEGWPHAIELALKAESLARELLYAVDTACRLASDYKMEAKCGVAVTRGYTEREQYRLISDIVRRAEEVLGDEV